VHGFPVAVVRAFNHTGPRQRDDFVVPALAKRILAVKEHRIDVVPVGNIDVLRDIGDVRDVVRAYRLLIESAATGSLPPITIVNVATGRSISIRSIIDQLSEIAEIEPTLAVDQSLVRAHDAEEIRGDASLIRQTVGWRAEIPLHTTLSDVWQELNGRREAGPERSDRT
jgi:GDP-4-dehydro-6-deoxy-D-mannose reductase